MTKRTPKTRKYLRSRITRKLILDTAQEVFLEKGYAKTTITKISQKAGVGYGTVYSHFQGKDDLLNKIVDHVMEGFFYLLNQSYKINHYEDLYHIFNLQIGSVFGLATEHRPILKVLREAMGQSETILEHWNKVLYQFIDGATQILSVARKKELTRDVDARISAKALVLTVESFFWEVVHEQETELDRLNETVTGLFLEGLISKDKLEGTSAAPGQNNR